MLPLPWNILPIEEMEEEPEELVLTIVDAINIINRWKGDMRFIFIESEEQKDGSS